MALANQNRNVYVLISDGECAEGSVWESLRIASELRLENLRITVNANGHGAYCNIDTNLLDIRLQMFYPTLVVKTNLNQFPSWVNGIGGHYFTMKEENYKEIMKNL
jgi:transketolase